MKNAGRAGIVPKDDFDINVKYKRLDAVMYDKSLYIAKKDVPLGTLPTDTTYWMKSIHGNKEPIATTETAGVVKPDGETITIDEDGTLHGQSKVNEMTGATADKDGTSGTVPAPKAGQEELFLRGDGTWGEAGTNITVDSELSKESTNPIENRAVAEEFEKKLNSDGDSKDLTTTFTSNDSTNVTEWTDVGLLTSGEKHSSMLQKIATMFKNVRYLYHMLGTADISTLGEGANIGTVTGALSKLNSDLSKIKGAYTVFLPITEIKTYNETAWTEINEFSYTFPKRSIFVGVVNIKVSRSLDGYIESFFKNRFNTKEFKANVINSIQYTAVGVAPKGDNLCFHLGTNENWITTIYGDSDTRHCYAEYIIIPLE